LLTTTRAALQPIDPNTRTGELTLCFLGSVQDILRPQFVLNDNNVLRLLLFRLRCRQ
jgi:hypothetical protein